MCNPNELMTMCNPNERANLCFQTMKASISTPPNFNVVGSSVYSNGVEHVCRHFMDCTN